MGSWSSVPPHALGTMGEAPLHCPQRSGRVQSPCSGGLHADPKEDLSQDVGAAVGSRVICMDMRGQRWGKYHNIHCTCQSTRRHGLPWAAPSGPSACSTWHCGGQMSVGC